MRIASSGSPSGYSGTGGAEVGSRTSPASAHCAAGLQVAGKIVGEETPDVEY